MLDLPSHMYQHARGLSPEPPRSCPLCDVIWRRPPSPRAPRYSAVGCGCRHNGVLETHSVWICWGCGAVFAEQCADPSLWDFHADWSYMTHHTLYADELRAAGIEVVCETWEPA